jgi:uncharacterized LabA/DUF88 family protein
MIKPLYAILLDGGFLTKKIYGKLKRHATADDIISECERLQALPAVADYELLRIYYYDAEPSSESLKLPVSKGKHELSVTDRYRQAQSLYAHLELKPYLALRMGEAVLSPQKWKIKPAVAKRLMLTPRPLADDDFVLDISQKGVDMRIGLDLARLALRDMVRAVIVVTGDSDFVPAFKFVRREGVKVILDPMGHTIRRELRVHADLVVDDHPKATAAVPES